MLIAGLTAGNAGGTLPGVILWITLFFVTILIFTTSFTREADRGTLGGLKTLPCAPSPSLPGRLYTGRSSWYSPGSPLLLFSFLFLNLNTGGRLPAFLIVYLLGAIGLVVRRFVRLGAGDVFRREDHAPLLSPAPRVRTGDSSLRHRHRETGGRCRSVRVLPEIRLLVAFLLLITAIMVLTFSFLLEE